MPDRTRVLQIRLTEHHVNKLLELGTSKNLDLGSLVQRIIQASLDEELKVPSTISRQLAIVTAKLLEAREELTQSRRAFESSGGDPKVTSVLASAVVEVSDCIRDLRDAVQSSTA